MLELKHVTKTFGELKALNDLTMTVPKGAVYGLVGPNGAGKSTAIRHITGIYRADSGTITLEGQTIYENPEVKQTIGLIPDDIFYFPAASMDEMANYYQGMYPQFDRDLYEKLFEIFQLPRKGQIRRFSKGMQKQAAFHLTLCCHPEMLVLDEPVDGLDPVMRRQVMSLILADVAEHGTTVLISSHNLRELEDVCDHVGIMDHGHMLLEKSLADMQGATHKLQFHCVSLHIFQAALQQHFAMIHNAHMIADVFQLSQIVRGDQHRGLVLGHFGKNQAHDLAAHHRIQSIHRLIQYQQIGSQA